MKIQHIRNATIKLEYGKKTFLIDPYLSEKFAQPSFGGKSKNPVVDLPFSAEEVISGVDYFIVSHSHPDHFDHKAQKLIPKEAKIFCQPSDSQFIADFGFKQIEPIQHQCYVNDIEIIRTEGQHGNRDEEETILNLMGEVSGFVFRNSNEPTLYWMGDTIWYGALEQIIAQYKPEIIICHSGGNKFPVDSPVLGQYKLSKTTGSLIMDKEQTIALSKFARNSTIIATHLGALDHESVSRNELIAYGKEHKIDEKKFFVPADGDILTF